MENRMTGRRFFASLRMTSSLAVILSEAKNLDIAPTHQIGTDSILCFSLDYGIHIVYNR